VEYETNDKPQLQKAIWPSKIGTVVDACRRWLDIDAYFAKQINSMRKLQHVLQALTDDVGFVTDGK